jgi:NADH-quinone oxidoreductase subunit M
MRSDVTSLLARIERATPPSDSQPTPGNPALAPAGHGEVAAPAAHGSAH